MSTGNPSAFWKLLYQSHRRGRFLCAVILSCLPAGACNTIYPHSDADQKAMEKGQEGYAASKTAQLDALTAHRAFIADTIAQAKSAVVKEQLALRDGDVASVLGEEDWQSAVRSRVESRVYDLTGEKNLPEVQDIAGGRSTFAAFISTLIQQRLVLAKAERTLRDASTGFEGLGGKIKRPCGVQGSGIETEPPASMVGSVEPIAEQAARVLAACTFYELTRAQTLGTYAAPSSQAPLSDCILSVWAGVKAEGRAARDACRGQDDSGTDRRQFPAYDALAELHDVELLIDDTRKLQIAVRAHLNELAQAYACALTAENAPDISERVRAAAQLVRDFVATLPESDTVLSEKVKASGEGAPSSAPAGTAQPCPEKPAEVLTFAGLLAKAGVKAEDLEGLLGALSKFEAGESVVAGLTKAKSDFTRSQLATVLAAVVAPPAGTDGEVENDQMGAPGTQDKAALVAASVVAALGPIQQIVQARQGSLLDTRAVLVLLAAARYEATLAEVQLAQLQRAKELLRLQADATLKQLAMLGRVQSTDRRVAAAYGIGESWNVGAIPAAAAAVDLGGLRYAGWEARERLAVVANYDSLQPLLDELHTYAAGGFTAEEIARAVSAGALVGIAIGVN